MELKRQNGIKKRRRNHKNQEGIKKTKKDETIDHAEMLEQLS